MLICLTYDLNTVEECLIDKMIPNLYFDFGEYFPPIANRQLESDLNSGRLQLTEDQE